MRKTSLFFVFLVLMLGLHAFSSTYAVTTDNQIVLLKDDGTWGKVTLKENIRGLKEVDVDVPFILGDIAITIKQVLRHEEFLVLDVFIVNNGTEIADADTLSYGFDIRDSEGYNYSSGYISGIPDEYCNKSLVGKIRPRGYIRGYIFFKIAKDVEIRELYVTYWFDTTFVDISKIEPREL